MSENYNATGEIKEIGILDMMNGAIGERAAYELSRIMKNCRDLNTEAKKARTLTIKLSIVPTENRDSVAVRAEVSSKLVPVSSRLTRRSTPNPRSSSWRKSIGGYSK